MKVFITGSTGYIGSAVVKASLTRNHQVSGLVRSVEKAGQLEKMGAIPVLGDLKNPNTYREAAQEADALIHLGFEDGPEAVSTDRKAIETLLSYGEANNQKKVVIYTSGIMVLGNTGDRVANEDASTSGAAEAVAWRPEHEELVLKAATENLSTAVIRPGMVYGGKKGIISQFFEGAAKNKAVVFIGDGQNRWPLVHVDDLAILYCMVAENRAAGIYHGVDGDAIRVIDIANVVVQAAGNGSVARPLPIEEARKQMGPFADAMCLDQVVAYKRSAELGWKPTKPKFPQNIKNAYEEWNE